jgi:hypothetical protein
MKEWRVLENDSLYVQKILNQWRHTYHIRIHGLTMYGDMMIVLLTREPKTDSSVMEMRPV